MFGCSPIRYRSAPLVSLSANSLSSVSDKNLQAAAAVLSRAFEQWLKANEDVNPAELVIRFAELIHEVLGEEHGPVAADKDEAEKAGSGLDEYGLSKKFKNWLKKSRGFLVRFLEAFLFNLTFPKLYG